MKIDILGKSDLNPTVKTQIRNLFRQLNSDINQINLDDVLDDKNPITFAYCSNDEDIIGIALMCTYKVISGEKGWIEDVVVDSDFRGQGIGRKLMNKLLAIGREKNLTEILLFSGHHRLSAISLYTDLGFQKRDSGIYILRMR